VVWEVGLQLRALLLAARCEERVVDGRVGLAQVVETLRVADEVNLRCHCWGDELVKAKNNEVSCQVLRERNVGVGFEVEVEGDREWKRGQVKEK
jgi:hypothetical protein